MYSRRYCTQVSRTLQAGDVVSVAVGPLSHVGIVTDRSAMGEPFVISNSRRAGGVHEEPLSEFAQGKPVHLAQLSSPLPLDEVLYRARSRLGGNWNVLGWNCEHFVRHALGIPKRSPQLRAGLLIGAIGIGLLATRGGVRA